MMVEYLCLEEGASQVQSYAFHDLPPPPFGRLVGTRNGRLVRNG